MKAKRYPRGAAFREACHAVVAWSLGLGARAVRISDDDARDAAEIGCADLSLIEQIALCSAGIAAENAFECPADELAGTHDREKIYKLLKANEISEEDQCEALRGKGYNWPESVWERTWVRSSDWRSDLPNAAVLMLPSFCI